MEDDTYTLRTGKRSRSPKGVVRRTVPPHRRAALQPHTRSAKSAKVQIQITNTRCRHTRHGVPTHCVVYTSNAAPISQYPVRQNSASPSTATTPYSPPSQKPIRPRTSVCTPPFRSLPVPPFPRTAMICCARTAEPTSSTDSKMSLLVGHPTRRARGSPCMCTTRRESKKPPD